VRSHLAANVRCLPTIHRCAVGAIALFVADEGRCDHKRCKPTVEIATRVWKKLQKLS
jgi:hypothetical protein